MRKNYLFQNYLFALFLLKKTFEICLFLKIKRIAWFTNDDVYTSSTANEFTLQPPTNINCLYWDRFHSK